MRKVSFILVFFCFLVISLTVFLLAAKHHDLEGKYLSDVSETLTLLKETKKIPVKGYDVLRQMLGNYTIDFNGYKCRFYLAPHDVKDYPTDGDTFHNEGFTRDYFCFTVPSHEALIILLIPTKILDYKNVKIIQIEIDDDGFWLIDDGPFSVIPKEKFTKLKL